MAAPITSLVPRIGRFLLLLLSASMFVTTSHHVIATDRDNPVTIPLVSTDVSPIEELQLTDAALAAIRKPSGEGPFPAVIFLHGGLGHASMENLREGALNGSTQARFLAWGFVAVNATRRAIDHDPQDRGVVEDTVAIVDEVKRLPYVDPDSVVLYGGSGGGTLALEVAGETSLAAVAAGEPATIIYMGMFTKEDRAEGQLIAKDSQERYINADLETLYTSKLQKHTRQKLGSIRCPVLFMHGDQHWLQRFNLELMVPEMRSLGKSVDVQLYPGEHHGFYWGRTANPAMALRANRDALEFFREHIKMQPKPIDASHIKTVTAQPRGRARDGEGASR